MPTFADRLLGWYDHHARNLPWRVGPNQKQSGTKPDPYHVLLSEIMLQQTTVATVKPYFGRFLALWPTVEALAAANIDDVMREWAGLGYYSRARNLHKAAIQVAHDYGGMIPGVESQLKKLRGVGDYTAAAVASIAFDQRAVVVDGNVERVIVRHENLDQPIADIRVEIRKLADRRTPQTRPGDYAQAMMDLGATICTPKNPQCLLCPVRTDCGALAAGRATTLPVKRPKPPKPVRRGLALLVVEDARRVWLKRNPDRGLLGGMLVLPTSDWVAAPHMDGQAKAHFDDWPQFAEGAKIDELPSELLGNGRPAATLGIVHHTFTHFHLALCVQRLDVDAGALTTNRLESYPIGAVDQLGLPTLMKKAWRLGRFEV